MSLTSKIQLSPFVSNFRIQPGQKKGHSRSVRPNGREGIDFVCCRICGDRRRVISGRHLSKHGVDRETYMEEYDLSPDELIAKDFRRIQSSLRGYQPYGKKEWLVAIRQIHDRSESVFAGDLQKTHAYLYHQGIWIFGDWDTALRAAGFEPEKMRMRRFWDKDRVVKDLRRMRKQNLPLYPNYVMKNHPSLFSGAVRQYGSWNSALLAAGAIDKEIARKTRLGLLRELRDAAESGSGISQNLRSELTYYFGSLRDAKSALKTDAKLLSGWSKRKIIALLARMHRSKEKLNYATVRRDHPALVSAAEAYFESWGRALHTAGIEPNLYFVHHRWREQKGEGVYRRLKVTP